MFFFAAPSAPPSVHTFCDVIVWDAPTSPNGNIMGYDIMFNFQDRPSTMERVNSNYFLMGLEIPGETMGIEVYTLYTVSTYTDILRHKDTVV